MKHRAWFCPVALQTYPREDACVYSRKRHVDVTAGLWRMFLEMAA